MTPAVLVAIGVLVGVVVALRAAMRPAGDPLPPTREFMAQRGRHGAGVTGEWHPAHRAGDPYTAAHRVGRRVWSGNLVEDTTMLSTRELAQLVR